VSFKPVFIAVVIASALIVGAFLLNRARPRVEIDQPSAEFVRASGKCAECHTRQQYSVVHEYETYESIPRFMPDVTRSVVRARQPGRAIVEQEAVSRVALFVKRVRLVLESSRKTRRSGSPTSAAAASRSTKARGASCRGTTAPRSTTS